ncbi:hypothetical protein OAD53_02950 [Gammaproteobacteria bacterium]|nr:hypothetical protein [Gammaproteobacteria bacterium]
METKNHQSFIEKYTDTLVPRIEETLLHKKPGYEFAIRVESKKTGEIWVSSTNNIEQRLTTLKSLAKLDNDKWNNVWQEAFYGSKFEDFIFEPVEDITASLLTEAVFLNNSPEHPRLLNTIARCYIEYLAVDVSDTHKSKIIEHIKSTKDQMMNIERFLTQLDEVMDK